MEFNEKLQELRNKKGLTQEELASALFVSRTAVSKWESGRGYPSIESLKAIANFFGITVDDLLKSEELLTLAEEDNKLKQKRFFDIAFGLLDISALLFFFLPLFVERKDSLAVASSLLTLSGVALYLRVLYFIVVLALVLFGILTLVLQTCENPFWTRSKGIISLLLTAVGIILFVLGLMPYAAMFLFSVFTIKILLTLRVSRV